MKRLTRAESQERTRERLLDAGYRVFAKEGFGATTVEQVVEAAGFTRGAFYSNFKSLDDLFLGLLQRQMSSRADNVRQILSRDEGAARRLEGLRDYFVDSGRDREWCLLSIEFQLYAARNPKLRDKLALAYREQRKGLVALVTQVFEELRRTLPAKAEYVASAMAAMTEGLSLQQLVDPTGVSSKAARETLDWFFAQFLAR